MSKIISGENALKLAVWETPVVDPEKNRGPLTQEQLDAIYRQTRDEGFAAGHREGLAAAREEMQAKGRGITRLLNAFVRPFEQLDETVEGELVLLATKVAQQLIRRELRSDPQLVINTVHEAVAALSDAAREIEVQLHPEDAALMRIAIPDENERGWRIIENAHMSRGDCRVASSEATVDATLAARLDGICDALLHAGSEQAH